MTMIRLTEALTTSRVGKYKLGDKVLLDAKPGRITSFEFSKIKSSAGVGWWARIQFTDGTAQWLDMTHVDKLRRESLVTEARPGTWKGAKIHFSMVYRGTSTHEYEATLQSGDWPPDEDLITLADGDTPPHGRHFGGIVTTTGPDKRRVEVFVD